MDRNIERRLPHAPRCRFPGRKDVFPFLIVRGRCAEDEALVRGIVSNSTASPHVDIVDARPSLNVYANTAAGGGIEPVGAGGYGKAVVTMLGIGNIHVMRDSYNKLRRHAHAVRISILSGGTGGEAAEEWLEHISLVMGGASLVAGGLERGRCAVLHCSHGWDRTSQVMGQTRPDSFLLYLSPPLSPSPSRYIPRGLTLGPPVHPSIHPFIMRSLQALGAPHLPLICLVRNKQGRKSLPHISISSPQIPFLLSTPSPAPSARYLTSKL
jgi:hypothetical protein